MMDRVRVYLTVFLGVVLAAMPGCTTGTLLQAASTLQLETTLISMMDSLLTTVVYNAIGLPVTATGFTGV